MAKPQVMQCMEVWGGNQPVQSDVVMAGLDAWVYCKPYGAAAGGGDVYYVSSCATGRITRLLVADVSGHGDTVSEVAGGLRKLMRRYVNYFDSSRFVTEMNRQFTAHSAAGVFATAVVTSFYASTNSLALCNAGHPPPLLYRAASRKWEYLYQDYPQAESIVNIPLGIDGISDYQQIHVELEVGDLVLCYTDSLPEARNAAGEFLGQDGLLEVLNSLEDTQPTKLIENLLGAIALRQDGNLASDDITLLLFRPNGLSKRPSLGKRLLAPIRLGGAILRRLGHPERPIPWPQMSVPNVGGIFSNALGARKILRSKGAGSRTTVPS